MERMWARLYSDIMVPKAVKGVWFLRSEHREKGVSFIQKRCARIFLLLVRVTVVPFDRAGADERKGK